MIQTITETLLTQNNNYEQSNENLSDSKSNSHNLIQSNTNVKENINSKFQNNYNEFLLTYKINESDKKIRFIGHNFYEINNQNCKMIIDDKELNLLEFYEDNKKNNYLNVTLLIKKDVLNFSYMFSDCSCLISFKCLSKLEINNITNTSYMFFGCTSLSFLDDISTWDMKMLLILVVCFMNAFL